MSRLSGQELKDLRLTTFRLSEEKMGELLSVSRTKIVTMEKKKELTVMENDCVKQRLLEIDGEWSVYSAVNIVKKPSHEMTYSDDHNNNQVRYLYARNESMASLIALNCGYEDFKVFLSANELKALHKKYSFDFKNTLNELEVDSDAFYVVNEYVHLPFLFLTENLVTGFNRVHPTDRIKDASKNSLLNIEKQIKEMKVDKPSFEEEANALISCLSKNNPLKNELEKVWNAE